MNPAEAPAGRSGESRALPERFRRTILGTTVVLFVALMVVIAASATYTFRLQSRALNNRLASELDNKLSIASSLLSVETKRMETVGKVVKDYNRIIIDYLDYDNIPPIEVIIDSFAHKYDVDLVFLYSAKGKFLAGIHYQGLWEKPLGFFNDVLGVRQERSGVEYIPARLVVEDAPGPGATPPTEKLLCFKTVVRLWHDTGGVVGYIILVTNISGNDSLAKNMAQNAQADVLIRDSAGQLMLTSFPGDVASMTGEGLIHQGGAEYLVKSRDITDFSGKPVGTLTIALDRAPVMAYRRQQLGSIFLTFFAVAAIAVLLFAFLKISVFDKISLLIAALRKVTRAEGELSTRVSLPSTRKPHAYLNEVDSMIADFNRMMDVLEQMEGNRQRLELQLVQAKKMEVIGTLAGGVAHDLNNILSGLVTYPEFLLMKIPPDDKLYKPLMTIQQSGNKAAAMVQDLLTLARRGVSISVVVNLNRIINEYLKSPEFERLRYFHQGIDFRISLQENLLNTTGSPVHLSKTLMNLVSNAAEAMANGGVITITTENRCLDAPVKGFVDIPPGEYAVLEVRDSGVGISPEDKGKIFEPFYTKKVMGRSGTGLGMTVVWSTVLDHDGYIDIESAVGVGTTFTVYLRTTRRAEETKEEPFSMEACRGRGELVLVVDDVLEQRSVAADILRELGYRVETVSSGEGAVDFARDNRVDLILLDMVMTPGIDGLETYRRIVEFRPGQKAVIASGFAENDRVKETLDLGAGAYLKKPYTIGRLGLAVRRELDRKEMQPAASPQ